MIVNVPQWVWDAVPGLFVVYGRARLGRRTPWWIVRRRDSRVMAQAGDPVQATRWIDVWGPVNR